MLTVCHSQCVGKYKAIIEEKNACIKELNEKVLQLEEDRAALKREKDSACVSADVRVQKKEVEVMTKMKNEISDAYSKGYSTALEHLEKQQTFFKQFMMPPAPSSLNMMHLHSSAGSSSSLPGGSRMTSPNTFN